MKNLILMISIFLFASCTAQDRNTASVKLKPAEFQKAMAADKDFVLLDVRTPEEVAEGKLEGAIVINFHDADFKQQLERLDKNKTIYVYCRSGNRSGQAAAILNEMQFKKVIDLEGGIASWKAEGFKTN